MSHEVTLKRGRYVARCGDRPEDVLAAQRLRYQSFRAAFPGQEGLDQDGFDTACTHVLVEDAESGQLVCCFRLLYLTGGSQVSRSYSAQFYDLAALGDFGGPMVEMGRFCIHPDWHDADILRIAWGAMTAFVDRAGIELLFGCSSFPGTDASRYADAFALLRDRHIAPECWRPRIKAPHVVDFAEDRTRRPDLTLARSRMPPLLRTYLLMGGWVSGHAVVDADLDTLHVFTGLEIRAVPPARARLLRNVAG